MSEANISESDLNGRYNSKGKEKVGKEGKKTQDGGEGITELHKKIQPVAQAW